MEIVHQLRLSHEKDSLKTEKFIQQQRKKRDARILPWCRRERVGVGKD